MNILIVRTDRLGDVLLTLPMASAIKKAQPNSWVAFLARQYTQPIIELCPDVDEIIVPDSLKLLDLVRAFRRSKANAAIFPAPRFTLALAAWLARIPIRIGTGYRWYSFLFSNRIFEHRKTAERHEAEYNLKMLSELSIPARLDELPNIILRKEEIDTVDEWIRSNIPNGKFAALHISSGGSTLQYPAIKFVELGSYIRQSYNMPVVLTGLSTERELLEHSGESIGDGTLLFIDHPVVELAALLARASVVISNSTGPGHLAATMGVPAIGLFPLPLALSKERWGYRGKRVTNISPSAITGCPDCAPCTCMERLDSDTVIKALNEVL